MSDVITIDLEPDPLPEPLRSLRRQVPFLQAKSLTQSAKDCQQGVKEILPDRFTLRSTWVQKGIRIKPAKKKALEDGAKVYSKDDFMLRQEEGGKKKPQGGKHVAVPAGIPRTSRGKIREKDKLKNLIIDKEGSRTFFLDGYRGKTGQRGNKLVARRIRKKVPGKRTFRTGKRRNLKTRKVWAREWKVLYTFTTAAVVKKRFGFLIEVSQRYRTSIRKHWFDNLSLEWAGKNSEKVYRD